MFQVSYRVQVSAASLEGLVRNWQVLKTVWNGQRGLGGLGLLWGQGNNGQGEFLGAHACRLTGYHVAERRGSAKKVLSPVLMARNITHQL